VGQNTLPGAPSFTAFVVDDDDGDGGDGSGDDEDVSTDLFSFLKTLFRASKPKSGYFCVLHLLRTLLKRENEFPEREHHERTRRTHTHLGKIFFQTFID
jgi:hypothetical protein